MSDNETNIVANNQIDQSNDQDNTAVMAEKTTDIFTAREQEIMLNALLCMKEAPSVDYNELASRLGMSNVRSASNAWAALRKKIQERNPNPDGGPILVPAKRTPAANKRKKAGAVPATPVKDEAHFAVTTSPEGDDDNEDADDDVEELGHQPASKKVKRGLPGLTNPTGDVGDMVLPVPAETPAKGKAGKAKTPATKPRAPRVKKEKVAAVAGEEGEDDAKTVIKKTPAKGTPRKKAAAKVVKSDATVKEEDDASEGEAVAETVAAAVVEAAAEEDVAMDVDEEDIDGVDVIGGEGYDEAGEV